MNKEDLKYKIMKQIDKDKEEYIKLGKKIYENPETGFKEFETTKLLSKSLNELGYRVEDDIAYTGCRAYGNENKNGIKIGFMGELDSVINKDHPDANENGAVHACGHNIQCAVMYGVASALIKSKVLYELDGKIDFIAIPAEEYIELDYRNRLKSEGKIKYYSGKQELIYRGGFDDIDMVMMIHSFPIDKEGLKTVSKVKGTGFIGKEIEFIGKETHAGGTPHKGINALNMANVYMTAVHAHRETFRDEDNIRVHQIITRGGDSVNTVPQNIKFEATVRANNLDALADANNKVNMAVKGGAVSIGGKAIIKDMPGYMPMNHDNNLANTYLNNAKKIYDESEISEIYDSTASFDIGDLSTFMPMLHPITSGIEGDLHSREFKNINPEDAYINPIKIMACTVIDLLYNDSELGHNIISEYKPLMSKEDYLKYLEDSEKVIKYQ